MATSTLYCYSNLHHIIPKTTNWTKTVCKSGYANISGMVWVDAELLKMAATWDLRDLALGFLEITSRNASNSVEALRDVTFS